MTFVIPYAHLGHVLVVSHHLALGFSGPEAPITMSSIGG